MFLLYCFTCTVHRTPSSCTTDCIGERILLFSHLIDDVKPLFLCRDIPVFFVPLPFALLTFVLGIGPAVPGMARCRRRLLVGSWLLFFPAANAARETFFHVAPNYSTSSCLICVCVCVCVCVFIKLHITTQSGPVILVILCHSH